MGAPSPAIMAILGVDAGTSRKPGCSVYVARSNAAPRHADTGPGLPHTAATTEMAAAVIGLSLGSA